MKTIETKSLLLRRFRPSDAHDLGAYLSNPKVYLYEPGEPISVMQARELALQRTLSFDFWAAELKTESRVVGQVSFQQIAPIGLSTWEIGFIFSPQYQRRGYATEAAKAIVAYAFRELCVHRIVAHCNPDNVASWKVLEKAGFTKEAHFRSNNYFRKDETEKPEWIDTYEYAILDSDCTARPRGVLDRAPVNK